jgi:hypothetical protein
MQIPTNVRTDQDVYHNARKHHSNKINGHLAVDIAPLIIRREACASSASRSYRFRTDDLAGLR